MICIIVVVSVIVNTVIIPNKKYNEAISLMNNSMYADAITIFMELDGYKESANHITTCEAAIKEPIYNNALKIMNDGQYKLAISEFEKIEDYKDSKEKIEQCKQYGYKKAAESVDSSKKITENDLKENDLSPLSLIKNYSRVDDIRAIMGKENKIIDYSYTSFMDYGTYDFLGFIVNLRFRFDDSNNITEIIFESEADVNGYTDEDAEKVAKIISDITGKKIETNSFEGVKHHRIYSDEIEYHIYCYKHRINGKQQRSLNICASIK